MEIHVFDSYMYSIGIIDSYESLIWIRRSSKVGSFELHCKFNSRILGMLKRDNLICKSNDLNECGYIENIYLEKNNKGVEIIKVTGKLIEGYIGRRIIWDKVTINDTVENAIRTLINNNCIDTIPERIIQNLELGELKNYPEKINYQVSYKNLEEEITKVANEKDLNYKVITDLENRKHRFEIYKGVDRTVNQSINSICIFSNEFENVYEESYANENSSLRNVAFIGGEGLGSNRIFHTIGKSVGLERYELFVDADDLRITDGEITITTEEYTKLLNQRGLEKLNEHIRIRSFESKVNVINSNLVYKKDFDLGDYVTCINKKWGVVINVKITEIEEVYEKKGLEVNVVFGNRVPTLIDKLKRR